MLSFFLKRPWGILVLILIIANVLAWQAVYYFSQTKVLKVCFLRAGQGTAIFIRTGNHQQVLINGGADSSILRYLRKQIPWWDKTINLVILTSPKQKHLYGLIKVLENYKVKNILWSGKEAKTKIFQEWKSLAKKENAHIINAKQGLKIKFAGNNSFLKILWPSSNALKKIKNINDTSIVSQLNSYGLKVLFTGDLNKKIEHLLLEQKTDLNSQVLQIPCHKSQKLISDLFLTSVNPGLIIISGSKRDSDDLSNNKSLEELRKCDIKVLSTINNKSICLIQKKRKPFFLLSRTE